MVAIQRVEMAYAGVVRTDGKIAYAYFNLDNRGRMLGDAQLYGEPFGSFEVGDVISIETRDNGRVALRATAKRVRVFEDAESITEWRVRHDAALATESAWVHKMGRELELLRPIREAYRQLDEEQGNVLIAQVVRYIVTK